MTDRGDFINLTDSYFSLLRFPLRAHRLGKVSDADQLDAGLDEGRVRGRIVKAKHLVRGVVLEDG